MLKGINQNNTNNFHERARYIKMLADQGDLDAINTYACMKQVKESQSTTLKQHLLKQYFKIAADSGNTSSMKFCFKN